MHRVPEKTLQINGQLHANKLENHVFETDKGKDFLKIEESNNQGEFQRTTLKVVLGPEDFTENDFKLLLDVFENIQLFRTVGRDVGFPNLL